MAYLRSGLAVPVFLSFASGYLLSYAFRSINAVIAPSLVNDVGLSNADLGLLSSAYFLSFASLQLPLGIWLDKYGPRRVETTLLLFAALGAAIFASSSTLGGLWLGRALIGVGVSACLMAPYTAYRQWFAPQRQSQLANWMLVAGTSGALASTVPVSATLPIIGWRGVFWIMSGLILAAAAAIFLVLRKVEAEYGAAQKKPAAGAAKIGYPQIFRNPVFRRMALLGMVNQGSFVALQTLWAGPWMMTVLGLDKQQTASALFAVNLCLMLAYLAMSWWAPRHVSQAGGPGLPVTRVIAFGVSGAVLIQLLILSFTGASSAWLLWLLLVLFIPVGTLVQTSVSLSFPAASAGRANSAYNFLIFIGAFIAQWGIGMLIDAAQAYGATPTDAMRIAFAICLACQAGSLCAFLAQRAQPGHA